MIDTTELCILKLNMQSKSPIQKINRLNTHKKKEIVALIKMLKIKIFSKQSHRLMRMTNKSIVRNLF
jgi:hypothetical protein